jgi:uncharacterized protein
MTDRFGLCEEDRALIREILGTASGRIEAVSVFGSRARGDYRRNSDIDLVLFGAVDEAVCARLGTLFRESRLPISVDLKSYDSIAYAPLRAHIDQVAQPLLVHTDRGLEDAAAPGAQP